MLEVRTYGCYLFFSCLGWSWGVLRALMGCCCLVLFFQNQNSHYQDKQISEKLWHSLFRQQYIIQALMFQLSGQQVTKLIQSTSHQQLKQILTPPQTQSITSALSQSPKGVLFIKLNNRTPKDLPFINRQIHNVNDFITILHSSQYLLQGLHKGQPAQVLLRHFIPQLAENVNVYQVFVRGGFVIGIGQKFCDHVEQEPGQQTLSKIISICQQIMPGVSLITPTPLQLNSFMLTLYTHGQTSKILSIHPYPHSSAYFNSIFKQEQLQKYYKEVEEGKYRSSEQIYAENEGVIPLIKMIKSQEEIKTYDMGQYLMGNEIADEEMMGEWKNFIKQAEQHISKDKQESPES